MAARDEGLPFDRGRTVYNGALIDTNNLQGLDWEGKDFVVEDKHPRTGIKRSNHFVRIRIIRWMNATFNAVPKRVVSAQASANLVNQSRADGFTTTSAQDALCVVDEYLPPAGCPANDCFWGVMEGPTEILTAMEGDVNNSIAVNTRLVALTGATSGALTAGRIKPQDLTGATSVLGNNILNVIGRAMSAKTTGQTNQGVLTYVGKW
jgi:hypothetical protein